MVVKLPETVPPLPVERRWERQLDAAAPMAWLSAGWRDLVTRPGPSLAYGVAIFLASLLLVYFMFQIAWDAFLFPALAGFLVVGPVLAVGLYEKSRQLETGQNVSLKRMIFVDTGPGSQVLFVGAVLLGLMLLWMRAAVLLYALFFGVRNFPGLDHIVEVLFGTPIGLSLLVVGSLVGGLFAAFAFAISAFSIPMVLDKRVDALTAMGSSMALVWHNKPVTLVWGAIVAGLIAIGLLTAGLGLILVFPLLGHASWHAYEAVRR